jgi:hypothetical protein
MVATMVGRPHRLEGGRCLSRSLHAAIAIRDVMVVMIVGTDVSFGTL